MASLDNIKLGDLRTLIVDTKIFCGTTTAFISKIEIFNLKKFDLAIIDEASQILEPFVLGLLSAKHGAENAIAKFVLIGDEKQLPAVVQQEPQESMVNDPMLNKIELEIADCRCLNVLKSCWERTISNIVMSLRIKEECILKLLSSLIIHSIRTL